MDSPLDLLQKSKIFLLNVYNSSIFSNHASVKIYLKISTLNFIILNKGFLLICST